MHYSWGMHQYLRRLWRRRATPARVTVRVQSYPRVVARPDVEPVSRVGRQPRPYYAKRAGAGETPPRVATFVVAVLVWGTLALTLAVPTAFALLAIYRIFR
jgi:hypothetical protein